MGPERRTLSPGRTDAGLISMPGIGAPMPVVEMYMRSALPCSTTLVSPPTMRTPASRAASAMACNFCLQYFGGQARFENESDDQSFGTCARNGEVVYGTIDGEFADGAAGKAQRIHDEAIGGDGDAARRSIFKCAASASGSVEAPQSSGAKRPSIRRRLALPPAP